MTRKRIQTRERGNVFVNFDFENRTYQIDPEQRKVYRRFVEIETAKASQIISVWRSEPVSA